MKPPPASSAAARAQITAHDWPKGLSQPVAMLSMEPDQLQRSLGITFEESFDGLDYTKVAILRLDSGAPVALVRHRNNPSPGTEVWIDVRAGEPALTLDHLFSHFRLEPEGIRWAHPSCRQPKLFVLER